jgi:hypothetical protein
MIFLVVTVLQCLFEIFYVLRLLLLEFGFLQTFLLCRGFGVPSSTLALPWVLIRSTMPAQPWVRVPSSILALPWVLIRSTMRALSWDWVPSTISVLPWVLLCSTTSTLSWVRVPPTIATFSQVRVVVATAKYFFNHKRNDPPSGYKPFPRVLCPYCSLLTANSTDLLGSMRKTIIQGDL